jgi:hypothetical protein
MVFRHDRARALGMGDDARTTERIVQKGLVAS